MCHQKESNYYENLILKKPPRKQAVGDAIVDKQNCIVTQNSGKNVILSKTGSSNRIFIGKFIEERMCKNSLNTTVKQVIPLKCGCNLQQTKENYKILLFNQLEMARLKNIFGKKRKKADFSTEKKEKK